MSTTIRVKSLAELGRVLKRDFAKKERLLDRAARRAAQRTAAHVRRNMPVAFGEARSSVRAEGAFVIADAPHAAALERGSRPHWVPLEALIRWVKLRGFQGLASPKAQKRLPGSTTSKHAQNVAGKLAGHNEESGYADTSGGASDMEGPKAVAKAIQLSIALHGTKPTWFMRDSQAQARAFLREEVQKALSEKV